MEEIIIDENFKGVKKINWWFELDADLNYPTAYINIKIPLICKSIVGKSLRVGESLEVGEWFSIFGKKTTQYANISIENYNVVLTTEFIKIGCQLHNVEEWVNFEDRQIKAMDIGALEWWSKWKNFIIETQKNLPIIYPSN